MQRGTRVLSMFGVLSLKVWLDDEDSIGPQWGSWNVPGLEKTYYLNISIKMFFFSREGHFTLY